MDDLGALIGASPAIEAVRTTVTRLTRGGQAARRPPAVLIQGETGTGKGLLASLLHRTGPRARGPFVDVNCAAIPETLLESELFGFERGAFTDARQAKAGLFQTANRGTIFLDEIALLSAPLQAKLLKVLEEGAVRRLGSTRNEPLDVWVVSATNATLESAIREGRFRQDLYHRLAVVTITLPPLRDRGGDVLRLADHFLARTCTEYGLPRLTLSDDARAKLATYAWPGNVRELANVIERASLLADGTVLTGEMLQLAEAPASPARAAGAAAPRDVSVKRSVANLEEQLIVETLTETSWNISQTAQRLGISRNTLRARIRKYNLQPGAPAPRPAAVPAAPVMREPVAAPAPAIPSVPATAELSWETRRLTLLHVRLGARDAVYAGAEAARTVQMLVQKADAFGGRVIELATSGLTAAFGFDPVEDAPRRAALAALAMQKAVARHAPSSVDTTLRAAIHVAQAPTARVGAVAEIDGDAKRRLWPVLDAVIDDAEPGAIALTEAAMPLLERRFAVTETGTTHVTAGRIHRLGAYRPTPFDLGGQMGRFVGRAHELGFLRDRFQLARHGQGQVVALAGDAGIGKSRLLFEFLQGFADQQVVWLQGHCFSYASSVPYFPILEVVRDVARVMETDTPEETADKIRRFVDGLRMNPQDSAPYLLHLLGIKDDTDAVATLGPEVIRTRAIETLHAIVLRTSERTPLVLAIEDLHWIDPASEEYLLSLVERITRARLLLVVTHRPGYQPPWARKSIASQMSLQPLAPDDSLTIVRVVFGRDEVAQPLADAILTKAEGNPFFLEELARAAREHGEAQPLAPPDTVPEVLLARINRLPTEDRRVLQSAAVIGKDFTVDVLREIAGADEDAVHQALQRLRAAEFIDEITVLAPEYTFKHALTHDVAYESLPSPERRALHAKTLEAIERVHAERRAENVERLAHHAFHGERWEQAVAYLIEAGRKAAGRAANREAVACFEQTLAALDRLPGTRARTEQAIDVRFEIRNPLHLLGDFDRIFSHLQQAHDLAAVIDDQARIGWVLSYLCQTSRLTGNPGQAIDFGHRAVTVAAARDDFALQVATELHLGSAYEDLGDYRRASEILRGIVERIPAERVHDRFRLSGLPSVVGRAHLVCCLAELGEFEEGLRQAREATRLAEEVFDPHGLVNAYFGLATLGIMRGDLDPTITVLERGLELCQSANVSLMLPRVSASLGLVYARSGRVDEGLALLEQSVERTMTMKLMNMYSIFLTWLGEASLRAGHVARAREHGERALARAREFSELAHEAHALALLGDVAAHGDAPDETAAREHYRQALGVAEVLGMRPLLGRCHLELGAHSRRAGDHASAAEHLRKAVDLFDAMDMRGALERAEGERKALG
jgi:DNA-binding NtrC family response regulator/tetratricopeptide (TPR) repeat protein